MSHSVPNFYAIIPATVRYCKDLPPAARLLYGELTALANKEGYCWASNKYFEELYEVGERTIRNWLEALQEKELIIIEIVREGFQVSRKIWITESIQKMLAGGKKFPEERKKNAGGPEKNFRQNNTSNNTSKKNDDIPTQSNQSKVCEITPSFFLEKERLNEEILAKAESSKDQVVQALFSEKERLRNEVGKTLSNEQFDRGYECYLESKTRQEIRNSAAWIITAALKKFSTKTDDSQKIKEVAKRIELHFANRTDIQVYALNKYLEVSYPGCAMSACFFYEKRAFTSWWEEVKSVLGKYGMPNVA